MRSPMQRRRALCIGVGHVAPEVWHPNLGRVHLPPLDSAVSQAYEMADSLESLGYVCTVGADVTARDMNYEFRHALASLDDTDLLLVYFVGYGLLSSHAGERLLVGAAGHGADGGVTALDEWIHRVERDSGAPQTLFLIDGYDIVNAGAPLLRAGDRAPVIAATTRRSGVDRIPGGTMTQAVCGVLRSLREGGLHIDRGLSYLPIPTFVRRVAEILGSSDHVQLQWSIAHSADSDEPPFFPNPAHAGSLPPGSRSEQVGLLALPDIEGVDAGLDAHHFLDRASGAAVVAEHSKGLVGLFSGRREELRRLTEWVDGSEHLLVVTGAPGAGKSALLGLFVAATHPRLRDLSRGLWTAADNLPSRAREDLVAVHARQRDVGGVCQSIGNQLGVEDVGSPERLLDVLRTMDRPPLMVIDALDEIADHQDLVRRLLFPLTRPDGPGGRPAARVIVSTRRLPEFADVLDRAAESGTLIDLDSVPAETLSADLERYVVSLLRTTRVFRHRGAVVNAFAQGVASTLTARSRSAWGDFLIAGLYSRWFANSGPRLAADEPDEAARVGHRVPTDLIAVLELDLHSQGRRSPWMRPALTALGSARGLGMPLSVLARVVTVFTPSAGPTSGPSEDELARAMEAARFYLRSVPDTDGSALYRVFHQAVAEHLCASAPLPPFHAAGRLLERLLATLGPPGRRDWTVAEPYVLRHALSLAAEDGRVGAVLWDPGFLLNGDPQMVSREAAVHDEGALPRPVWTALCDADRTVPERLFAAILAAHRADENALADRLARMPGAPTLAWQPRWARPHDGRPQSIVAVPARDGGVVVVLNDRMQLAVFDAANGARSWASLSQEAPVGGIRPVDLAGRTFVLLERPGSRRELWDPRSDAVVAADRYFGEMLPDRAGRNSFAVAVFEGRIVEIVGDQSGTVGIVDGLTREVRLEEHLFAGTPVTALTAWDDGGELTVLAADSAGVVLTWRPGRSRPLRVMDLSAPVHAITVTREGVLLIGTEREIVAFRAADDNVPGALGGRVVRR